MMTYFAADGSYGDGEDILVIDTHYWTEEMWEEIDSCGDSMRIALAHQFSLDTPQNN